MSSLQELSGQLAVQTQAQAQTQTQGSESLEAQERVHVIGNRLRLLLNAVASDLQLLDRRLQASGDAHVSLYYVFTLFTFCTVQERGIYFTVKRVQKVSAPHPTRDTILRLGRKARLSGIRVFEEPW